MFDLKQRSCSFQTVYKGTRKLELWPQTELGFLHGNWGFQSSCFSPAAVPTFSNRSSGLYVSFIDLFQANHHAMAAALGWNCLAKAGPGADQSCKSIHVDSLRVSRLSSFMESRLQPGTPLQHKTTSIPFRTLSQALKNQTNQEPDAQEFYTDAQYGSDFGYYSTGRILHQPSAQDIFFGSFCHTGTWYAWSSSAWDMSGSIRINVLQFLHHSADAPQLRKGIGGLQTALFLLESVCTSKVDMWQDFVKWTGNTLTVA